MKMVAAWMKRFRVGLHSENYIEEGESLKKSGKTKVTMKMIAELKKRLKVGLHWECYIEGRRIIKESKEDSRKKSP